MQREGWNTDAQPGSLDDAHKRIADTTSLLSTLAPKSLDEGAKLPIALELPNGVIFDMNGDQYARDWSLPQFYFHIATAYVE